jgi:8-oxo-dGTP pyrophosphatase MutT (NUDIX family)
MSIDKEINMEEVCTGAGIVVYYDNRDEVVKGLPKDIVYLILVNKKGYYDFPKGCIEFGEYSFDCALRETYEEINLDKKDFERFHGSLEKDKFSCGRGLVMFIGKIKEESLYNTKIKKNEKTGNFEHIKFLWIAKDKIFSDTIEVEGKKKCKLPLYLQECLNWASQKIV